MHNVIVKESENKCPNCDILMQRRSHSHIRDKQLKQPFYFSEWDCCSKKTGGCGFVKHYEKYKVWTREGHQLREREERQTLFDSLM